MTVTRFPICSGVRYRTGATGRVFTFTFAFVREAQSWRAYIQNAPAYDGRPEDGTSTHRLLDLHGPYVCWNSPVRTLPECRAVAALWAESTENYLATGTFSPLPSTSPDST